MIRFIVAVRGSMVLCILLLSFSFLLPIAHAHTTATPHIEVATTTVNELQSLTDTLKQSANNQSKNAAMRAPGASVSAQAGNTELLGLAKRRGVIMRALAKQSPETFLRNVIPTTVRKQLPDTVQTEIEQATIDTGIVEVMHSDDFVHPEKSTFEYTLKQTQKRQILSIAGDVPALSSGDQISASGYLISNFTVAAAQNIAVITRVKPESVGDQKTLVIPVIAATVGTEKPYTKEQIYQLMFKGSIQDYFKEQSYNQVSFSGSVLDWVTVPNVDYPETNCVGNISVNQSNISAAIKSSGIDITKFGRVVFVMKERGYCGVVGKLDLVVNGVPVRLSESWDAISEGIKGSYQLFANEVATSTSYQSTSEEYAFTHCRIYAKNNSTQAVRCTWNGRELYNSKKPANWSHGLSKFGELVAHEMGHNLGVMHANALYCTSVNYSQGCTHQEYGNNYDVMGYSMTDTLSDGGIFRGGHYNAFYKNYLGWLSGTSVRSISQTAISALSTLEIATGTRMLKITNPALPNSPLYVEYRKPFGFDAVLKPTSAGLFINEVSGNGGSIYSGAARLLNANQVRNPNFDQPALMPGQTFSDSGRGITIGSPTLVAEKMQFQTIIVKPVCTRGSFTIQVSPMYRESNAIPDSNVQLHINVHNGDSPACPASNLQFSSEVVGHIDWNPAVFPAIGISTPGSDSDITYQFYVPAGTPDGVYTMTVTVTDTANNRVQNYSAMIAVVAPASITSLAPSTVHTGDRITLTGSGFSTSTKNIVQIVREDVSSHNYWYIYNVIGSSTKNIKLVIPKICRDFKVVDESNCATSGGTFIDMPDGKYSLTVITKDYTAQSNQSFFTVGAVTPPQPLTLTTPNGGEQWELGAMHEITWSPYEYTPSPINPSSDVVAYLERATTTGYTVVGKIFENGKASIHWQGDVRAFGTYPMPGKYFVRVVNTKTKEWDRSDAPFTLLPRAVNLKVNGSDGPVTVTDNQAIKVSWTANNVASCSLSGVRQTSGGATVNSLDVPAVATTQTMYADVTTLAVFMYCTRSTGETFSDYVALLPQASAAVMAAPGVTTVGGASPSLKVTSPNAGESLAVGTPYTITWNESGLVRPSVALYQHDKWVKWLATSFNQTSLVWTPTTEDVARSSGDDYKIYVTAEKIDGTGYADDKSDVPFKISGSQASAFPVAQSSTLSSASVSNGLLLKTLYRSLERLLEQLHK